MWLLLLVIILFLLVYGILGKDILKEIEKL